jgi:hypothetical protein
MMADEIHMSKEIVRKILVQDLGIKVSSEACAMKLDVGTK